MSQVFCPRCRWQVPAGPFCNRCGLQLGPPAPYPAPYIPPQRVSKPGVSLKLVMVAVAIALTVFALMYFGARYKPDNSIHVTTVKTPSDRETISRIGDRVEREGIALTLVKTTKEKSLSRFETAEKGNVYLIAEVLIENISRDSAPYNPLYFKVKDWDGLEYRSSIMTGDGALQSGDIFKGDKVRGKVAFKIKENASGLVMSYEPLVIFGGYEPIKIRMY